ncbi:putative TBC domain-containing protein [Neospora caninum Liverpool]|uniref:Putative TBC domain-containing protein n=1 Tax=Neospora caninum (strain Liverpool) TaxID=572307 RepID=F0VCI1_NEOCL|nr:putative TBC domain-containing protein [Neospora caninum Liverpool]CBZ51670.1 putative TBC domain-containing protein [Neospora caninum Liverpool]|eukprot:XP_003881703.1 putative TBC domain-containing protein [Neospora caninum Liverpool]
MWPSPLASNEAPPSPRNPPSSSSSSSASSFSSVSFVSSPARGPSPLPLPEHGSCENSPKREGARRTRRAETVSSETPAEPSGSPSKLTVRAERFCSLLERSNIDLNELKQLLWSGVPKCCPTSVRSDSWRIVLGYLPVNRERVTHVLAKKRSEYKELLEHYYEKEALSVEEGKLLRQLRVDIPRTHSGRLFFSHPRIQGCMERALFLWAVKNPASGYVQGINDLITPFLSVFLESSLGRDPDTVSIEDLFIAVYIHLRFLSQIPVEILEEVEADSFWCLSKLLAHIQDHFTFGQPGIQRSVLKLTDIVKRVDEPLYVHLTSQGVDFLQMSFRWMNCLLMREFPLRCVIRLWDTYIAEQAEGFSSFHVYVCAVFLVFWSPQLKEMNFQQLMIFIQNFPTADWTEQEIETLLAEAYASSRRLLSHLFRK